MRQFVAIFLLMQYLALANAGTIHSKHEQFLENTVRLNDGHEMPIVGLGTYETKPEETEQAVKDAIDIGYRHIDNAYNYHNEREVGNAIRAKIAEGVIKREDIFVTTKLWSTFHEPSQVPKAFLRSFENLNISYIDLLLIHYPVSYARINKDGSGKLPSDVDDVIPFPRYENGSMIYIDCNINDTWLAMEALVKSGSVHSIGVSNFNHRQLERLMSFANIKPVINQVEVHPNLDQTKLIEFMKKRNVMTTAYSPLGRPHVTPNPNMAIRHPKIIELAQRYHKTPAQMILRYTIQLGAIVVPKSTNKWHMRENLNVFDFVLTHHDMRTIRSLNTNHRLIKFEDDVNHPNYPFKLEY